jgi:hypothetical protein
MVLVRSANIGKATRQLAFFRGYHCDFSDPCSINTFLTQRKVFLPKR